MTSENEILEDALAKRLAKLAGTPVDTTHLDKVLRAQLPASPAAVRTRSRSWLKPFLGIAASFILLATVALVMFLPAEAQASVQDMVRIHREMVAETNTTPVSTTEQASRIIAAMGHQAEGLPTVPDRLVHACCMRSIKNKQVIALLLKEGNTPVTLTVAAASDMKCPSSPTVTRGGIAYRVSQVDGLTMVMTERNNRWICLVSEAPQETLIALAEKLQY